MGDLTGKMDRFVERWQPGQGPSCPVGLLMAALPVEEADALRRLFASRVYATDIAKFVQSEVPVEHPGDTTIASLAAAVKDDACQRHRRGACACRQDA